MTEPDRPGRDVVGTVLAALAEALAHPPPETPRTDPWRWYCRRCGDQGEHPDRAVRDEAADRHLGTTRCGTGRHLGRAESGRLLHVWTYNR